MIVDAHMKALAQRLQNELAAMRAFQQNYLDRRASRGRSTATDIVIRQQQQTISDTLGLLELIKADREENNGSE